MYSNTNTTTSIIVPSSTNNHRLIYLVLFVLIQIHIQNAYTSANDIYSYKYCSYEYVRDAEPMLDVQFV